MEDYLNVNEKLKYEVIKKVVEGKKRIFYILKWQIYEKKWNRLKVLEVV